MHFIFRLNNSLKVITGNKRSTTIAFAGKWMFYFILIRVIAGLGSIAFHFLYELGMHFFLDMMAGYRASYPAGEHRLFTPTITVFIFNKWILLFLPSIGGIISGWIVYTYAPETKGHGTDAAIDAYHTKGGFIRTRVPFIKVIAYNRWFKWKRKSYRTDWSRIWFFSCYKIKII